MRQTIEIETWSDGIEQVEASICLDRFAIHKTLHEDSQDDSWDRLTLTHIGTKWACIQDIANREALPDLAKRLSRYSDAEFASIMDDYEGATKTCQKMRRTVKAWRAKWGL